LINYLISYSKYHSTNSIIAYSTSQDSEKTHSPNNLASSQFDIWER